MPEKEKPASVSMDLLKPQHSRPVAAKDTHSRSMQVASGLSLPGRLGPNHMLGGITL